MCHIWYDKKKGRTNISYPENLVTASLIGTEKKAYDDVFHSKRLDWTTWLSSSRDRKPRQSGNFDLSRTLSQTDNN
jgi:hypothetical protein